MLMEALGKEYALLGYADPDDAFDAAIMVNSVTFPTVAAMHDSRAVFTLAFDAQRDADTKRLEAALFEWSIKREKLIKEYREWSGIHLQSGSDADRAARADAQMRKVRKEYEDNAAMFAPLEDKTRPVFSAALAHGLLNELTLGDTSKERIDRIFSERVLNALWVADWLSVTNDGPDGAERYNLLADGRAYLRRLRYGRVASKPINAGDLVYADSPSSVAPLEDISIDHLTALAGTKRRYFNVKFGNRSKVYNFRTGDHGNGLYLLKVNHSPKTDDDYLLIDPVYQLNPDYKSAMAGAYILKYMREHGEPSGPAHVDVWVVVWRKPASAGYNLYASHIYKPQPTRRYETGPNGRGLYTVTGGASILVDLDFQFPVSQNDADLQTYALEYFNGGRGSAVYGHRVIVPPPGTLYSVHCQRAYSGGFIIHVCYKTGNDNDVVRFIVDASGRFLYRMLPYEQFTAPDALIVNDLSGLDMPSDPHTAARFFGSYLETRADLIGFCKWDRDALIIDVALDGKRPPNEYAITVKTADAKTVQRYRVGANGGLYALAGNETDRYILMDAEYNCTSAGYSDLVDYAAAYFNSIIGRAVYRSSPFFNVRNKPPTCKFQRNQDGGIGITVSIPDPANGYRTVNQYFRTGPDGNQLFRHITLTLATLVDPDLKTDNSLDNAAPLLREYFLDRSEIV